MADCHRRWHFCILSISYGSPKVILNPDLVIVRINDIELVFEVLWTTTVLNFVIF